MVFDWIRRTTCALAFACASPALAQNARAPERPTPQIRSSYGESERGQPPPITFEAFVERIRASGADSVERAIRLLPSGMRGRYALMYRSRSLQAASFQAPRAILFESDGSFLASFNGGDPRFRGHDKIEAIQFRADKRRWEFREIAFAQGQPPRISEPNPRKCLECHQSPRRADVDPRPNWEPYSTWPGAYGSVDGKVGQTLLDSPGDRARLRPEDAPIVEEQKLEAAELAAFERNVKPKHPRYRELGEFKGGALLLLTDVLVAANSFRVARLLPTTPDWDVYKDAFFESVFCDSIGPGGARSIAPSQTPPEILAFWQPALADLAASVLSEGLNTKHRMQLFFDSRGVDSSDWSMDFKTGGRFAFRDRFGSPSSPEDQLRHAMRWEFNLGPAFGAGASCAELRARAAANASIARASGRLAQATAELAARTSGERERARAFSPEATLARCARCHGVGADEDAPEIPFDDLVRLRPLLARPHRRGGTVLGEIERRLGDLAEFDEQMPPSGQIPPRERGAVLDFLRSMR